jgi:hypothetical protein
VTDSHHRLDRRAAFVLVAVIGLYLGLLVVLAATGRFTFVWKTAVVPVMFLVALFTGSVVTFIRDWAAFLATIVLFDCARGFVFGLITHFGLPFYAAYVIDWDQALLGGQTLPTLLQSALFKPPVIGLFDQVLVVVHSSHFVFFLLFTLAVWLLRRDEFWRARRAFVILMAVGITCYLVVPTVPPWMATSQFHLIPPLRHISAEIYNLTIPTLQQTFDVNPIGAMPSLHTAFPTLCSIIALHHFGWRAFFMPIYTFAVYLAIGYLGEHYIVDIIAGILLALAIYVLCYRVSFVSRRRAGADPRWLTMRFQMLIALLLVVGSEGIGQLGESLRTPLVASRAFVARDLAGRSDRSHLFLARLALNEHDFPTADKELELSLGELKDPRDRRAAAQLLTRLRGEGPPGPPAPLAP